MVENLEAVLREIALERDNLVSAIGDVYREKVALEKRVGHFVSLFLHTYVCSVP